jgi:hypothetical protein
MDRGRVVEWYEGRESKNEGKEVVRTGEGKGAKRWKERRRGKRMGDRYRKMSK